MDKDIAVIGMACRFPGADNCEKYWDQLKHGFFAIQEIPSSRWVWNEYKENSSFPDEMGVCRWGSFINNVSSFDADFFNISGREAESMDPQQRIMLELAWACFEDAGIPPSCVSGNKVGVYTGVFNYDYKELQERDPAYVVEAHHSTGTAIAAIPNRISYYFNLTGPSLPIDTACASSLHAIHLAAQALNTGECEMALAGGISLLLTPTRHISFSKTGMLSPTGTCRVFDEAADGYLRGEGAGLILLKPLKKAMADGDHIYGIVKGSAANHSGKVRTLTYPNPDAQADVIITAMKMAGTTPDTISYIEAHGTGTPKGDPIEFEGLCKAFDYFRETMPTGQFCGMGSVKANIGHLESAAGIAGVIKVLMAMKYRQLPGQINYKTLNPRIAIDRSPFYIVQDLQEWKSRRNIAGEETPRRAGVSSFGFGGTNTHVILEEPPLVHCPLTEKFQEQVICLSAKTRSALKRKIEELIAWLENHPSASIAELSAALLAGREHFNIRIAFVADGITEVKKKLMTLLLQDMPEPTAVAKIHGEFITADLMRVLEPEEYITQEEYIRLLNRLADEYNKGSQWDKNVLYAMRRRHCSGLPTYPFEKSVYWITTTPPVRELPKEHNTNPLLQQVTTQPGRFTSTFSGEEFFLKDHVVFGRKILPGVAYLEMARAAAEKVLNTKSSASICIENVVWRQPFRMNSVSATLYIDVSSLRADALTYKVYSNSEAGQAVVHGTGTVCIHHIAVPDSYDSSLLQKGVSVKRAACYRLLSDAGLEYGPGHQALEEIFERQGAVTGRIKLPVVLNATRDTYVLHPAILDAALQAAFLMFHKDADKTQVLVPFTLDSLNIYKPCTTDMWAIVSHSKYTSDKKDVYRADIDICDMDGQVCIQMKGVAFRPLQKERDQVSTLILRPDWKQYQEKQELPFVYDHHRVVLCGWERDHGSFVEEALNDVTCTSLFTKASVIDKIFTFYAEMLFVTAKDILTECAGEKIRIQVVISPDLHAVLSGLSGLLMTAAAEHVFFHWQLIDVTEDSLSGVIECLKKNWNTPINQHIRYEGTKRMIRGWEEITTSLPLQKIPWKADGVYLITGGTGGLGQVFAREILTRQPSANLILTGRSAPDSFSGQREYAHIEYRQADVCDAAAVAALMTDIKETYGKLDGILHCAGVIRDNYIIKKSTEELKDILAPKVNGLTVLDQESIGFDLDFFILFSSFAGAFGNVGQADYAMANAFMDAYSDYRNILVNKGLRAGHTLSVNWPLWASGGMQPDRASVRLMRQRYGITSMDTHAGISSLYKVLGAAAHQVAVLDGDATEIKKKLLGTDCVHSSAEHGGNRKDRLAVDVENLTISLKLYAADLLKVAFTLLTDDTPFDEFGFDSILYTAYTEKLNEVFNLRIGPPLLYECNTFRELADYLLSNYLHIAPSESSIIDLPLSVSSNERQDGMIKKIMELVASLLGMSIDSLSPDTDLSEYGFDSLTYTELASYVEEEYNISVTPTLFFRYTDIRKIATYLQHNYPDSLGKKTDSRFISSELQPAAPSKILENAGLSTQSLEDVPQSFKSGMAEGIMESPRQPVNVPVAVIGMAGRFPMADNIDMFWENMVSERDCISETPQERWDWHAYAGSSANSPLRWGGYIDGLWDFDPMFFNISPREATYMDPQQRLLMMYVWKVIEDAGYAPRQLSDTSTALFIGMGSHEHNQLLALSDAKVLSFSTTGTFLCIGPNRISHFFNLHGPSEPVETACSSSLVAIHKAVELLRNGGCNVAIAGGINALQRPETSLSLHKGGMLSEDGRCRAFSADANGYVRSEGIGLIMLKRLDDAERDGDHIYGVIRSSAVNHGGHTHSLTAPNAKGQTALLISAYRQAGIDPRTISYIEAHGTGTKLGDPVEMNALIAAFKELYTDHRIADDVMRHCGVGSVKSNIGHLEWASGIGGVIKVLLQMQNKMLVKSLHAAQVNPFIELQGSPFYIVQQTSAWKALKDVTGNELPRRAGISSFGFGGVNAHLVLEEYVPTVIRSRRSPAKPLAFILSAKSRQQVKNQADQLLRAVKERSYTDEVLPDIAYTLQIGRDVMSVRVGFIADNSAELLEKLQKLASGIDSPDLFYGDTERYTPASPEWDERIEKWIISENIEKLLTAWIEGHTISWQRLYNGITPQRISLPTYPFSVTTFRLSSNGKPPVGQPANVGERTNENNEASRTDDRIAIIGMSGKYPDAPNLRVFWDNLAAGRCSVSEITSARWDVEKYYKPWPGGKDKMYCKWMAMLDDITGFDPLFFNISPEEAGKMDPHHRIALEQAYLAFGDAGYNRRLLTNKKCGVYLGMFGSGYGTSLSGSDAAVLMGSSCSVSAGRISYCLNLKGPALVIDTACSSSLVAIHTACQALRMRETDMAVAGGITLCLNPGLFVQVCSAGMLSPDGLCKVFDDSANGFVPGEGVGWVVLKRLQDAEADHDHIYGVIAGSGINQDGKTQGITAPSQESQMEVEREVYERFHIQPGSISNVEMHGTGTKLGDPIELEALSAVYREKSNKQQYCAIGSVKSNIGHAIAAAGVAGVQKVLLGMLHKQLPPTINMNTPNKNFNFETSPFYINTQLRSWKSEADIPLRAAVSSFGFSGTNAHLVIESYPEQHRITLPAPVVIVLSAQNAEQLKQYVSEIRNFLLERDVLPMEDIAFTLQTGRDDLAERVGFIAADRSELLDKLTAFVTDNKPVPDIFTGRTERHSQSQHAFQANEELKVLMQEWTVQKNYNKLLELWIKGFAVDWTLLYNRESLPFRVSLPLDPFRKEHYQVFLPDDVHTNADQQSDGYAQLHPLLHQNVSTLNRQRFRTIFTGEELFFCDHIIHNRRILPGVAYLEMVYEAVRQSTGWGDEISIVHISWQRPLIADGVMREVFIELKPVRENDITFEVYQELENRGQIIYVTGSAARQELQSAPMHNIAALQTTCKKGCFPSDTCYQLYREGGFEYGPALQAMEMLFAGQKFVLAKLVLPESLRQDINRHTLHPSLMDAALQAIIGLGLTGEETGVPLPGTAVPYKLDQLLIYKKCSPVMWAVIRPDDTNDPDISQYKVNIDICEESGYVCITLRGCHLKDVSHWADSASPHIVAVDSPVTKPADGEWQRNLLTAEILRLLTKELAGILKVNVSDLDPDAHFSECGLDSMLFSAFANRMNEIWNLEITPVIFYEYRSLGNLTKFLAAEYHHHFISLLPPSPISQRGPVPVSSPSAGMTDSRLQKKKQVRLATGSSQTGNVPVAIIGMAGRFPMADDLNEYWENIRAGKDCISETPADRWDWRTYADTLKSGLRWGGYMKGVKEFDPLFFNISPEEASYMDPQQRLLLMYTWKAIEDAGYSPYSLAGSKTAVFAGTALHDYRKLVTDAGAEIKGYYSTGLVSSIGPNRISYLLDLHGPSEPVETACSSSLVAVHKAAEVLVSGSCDLALAGGVNTLLSPELSLSFWKGGMTSPDGRCKTFSSSANGYVRGEGVAVIVLKRLEDAERDGDHIYGIIRGSTVSHGGHTNSLTAPSVNAQSEVIRDAYKRAGIDPRTVGYIEAHGTGTKLGDPIEINALKAAFQELYAEGGDAAVTAAHCGIGAVKSNIGHLELAAGIAGIVKVLLQLQHKTLVKSLHAESVNPLISLQNSPFYIVHQNVEWKPISDGNGNALPRRAGISSFGFGGVNAHIVLEEYTATPREVRPDIPFVIVLSAETQTCLHAYAALLIEMVEEGSVKERDLPRIAYTLQTGRPALKQRVAFIADSLSNLKKKLEWLISGVGEGNGIYCGQTGDHKQIHFLHTDDDWDVIVDTWISRGKYSKLLELWSKGANLSWHRLYPTEHPQRISLPGYPFAEEYCWIQDNSIVPEDRKLIPASRLHPLLHEDISTDGLQRFCTTFTGEEFYLKDHIINGKSVLPGVAYLEMARAAAQLSAVEIINKGTYVAIKNVAWIQPFFFNSVAGKVFVELAAGVSQNIPYLVYSEDKAGNKHKYHQGVIVTGNLSAAPIFDLPALQAKHCSGFTVSKEEYYRALEKAGLALGASHKCLDTLSVAENEVLAHIMLPTPLKEEAHTYIMHPALMDAALQGAMMLLIDYLPYQRITLQLPFSLEELIVYGNVNTDVWLTARFSTGSSATDKVPKLDISLINEQGNVLVSIKGFSALAINVADSGTGTLCFHPFWEAAAIVSKLPHTYKHRLIMLCEKEPSDSLTAQAGCSYITLWSAEESIDKKFKAYAGQALLAFQDLIKTYAENAVLVQLLITHDLINIGFSGLSGLLKTAEREHPGLQCQLIEIYDKEHEISLSKILDENSVYPEDKHIRYRGGERQVKRWKQIEETTSGTLPWKNDGVYLIIGGLSGIGLLFAEEIAHHAANVSLILVARSAPDDYAQQKMMSLQQLGATVEYRLGDIGNETAVATLFDHIRKNYGRLNGILHSAGVIKDSFIIRKTAWELQQVLATKVSGLVLLDRESRDFDLDIFVVFSSVTGALGNAGQADHAMANAFMDEYVSHYGEQHQQLLQQHDDAVLAEMTEIENRLPALLLRQLQSMQLFLDVHTGCTIEELKVHIGLSPLYHRWMRETLRILVNAGLLRSNGERYTLLKQLPGAEVLWKEWEEQCAVWVADPDLDAWARFVSITLRALPEILTARRPAVQIIFPGSSMVLAEGVYKNNCVFDYFNSLVGNYVVAYVNDFMRQKPRQKLRILEIGAGTGATSAYIFKKLQPYSQHIAEYCFTDISRAFLLHAENEYGPDYPYLTYHLFNVEEPVNAQSIGVETYDIVIAANVLHATSDIQLAIRNCCSTLKEGGLLLLIELRDKTVYQHLTFGLLEGWWLHQDTTLRIPGSPGLYPETWKRVLEEEGCCDVCFPANRMEMQVITAQKAAATPVPPFSAVYNDYCRCRQTVPETRMLSVNWPYWKEGKTLVDEQVQQKLLHQFGLLPMDARSGIQAFYRAVASGEPQVAVMHGNMGKIKTIFINSPEESSVPETEPVGPITDRLITEEKVTDYFRSFLSAALRLPIESVQNETPMEEYGIDSLMMIQLTNQLQQTFGPLPHTLFLEYPNLKEVSGYFINRYPELLSRLLSVESITNNGAVTDDPGSQNTEGLTKPEFIAEVSQPVTAPSNTLSGRTDIAIIGVAGSYPGAENIYQLWDNLKNEKDSVIEIPSNRWDYHLHFDEAKASSGKAGCKYGGFLENVNKFDPLFFNISPREAENMEPQERLFLQCAYETLEDAGYTRETLNIQTNGRVGVFVGASYLEYQLLAMEVTLHGTPRPMLNLIASIANRVSYYFDFKGPSMGVDTMCSSSLTALHLACNSIYQGDCEVAIAGGVNVSLHPNKFLILREKGLLSFKGRCRSFGKGGDGMVPAEGVGGVLLKPLSKAIEDGDNIYGVIKGTCISHGGKTNGYTVPNPASQQEIILQTLRTSGIDARNISYVEAHGTGTELGDPVEIEGLSRAFRDYTDDKQFCTIGSVKSNIGHCESAAGIAGLTKVLLQLRHRQLVPSLHAETLNPFIDFTDSPFKVQRQLTTWERRKITVNGILQEVPLCAGVSSFGGGGSNAHIVLQEFIQSPVPSDYYGEMPVMVILSAGSKEQLQQQAERLLLFVEEQDLNVGILPHLAYTLQVGRRQMAARIAFIIDTRRELSEKLKEFINGIVSAHQNFFYNPVCQKTESDVDNETTLIYDCIQQRRYTELLKLWTDGYSVDWQQLYINRKMRRISLPVYPFSGEHYQLTHIQPLSFLNRQTEKMMAAIHNIPVNKNVTVSAERIGAGNISMKTLQNELAVCLGEILFIPASGIDVNENFLNLGLDSILGVEWIEMINKKYNLSLPATRIYDYPTLREMAEMLNTELAGKTDESSPADMARETIGVAPDIVAMLSGDFSAETNFSIRQLQQELAESLGAVLYLPGQDIDTKECFLNLGLDSVLGVEWIMQINKQYELSLPATVLYDHTSVIDLAAFLETALRQKHNNPVSVRKEQEVSVIPSLPVVELSPVVEAERTVIEKTAALPAVEGIAIIGYSGQLPESPTPGIFWSNLLQGKDCISKVPENRWSVEAYYDPVPGVPGKTNCQWMGVLQDADKFDPRFFNISPADALRMDPQQRLFLAACWHCIEDAGINPASLSGNRCGVYVGCSASDYYAGNTSRELSAQELLGSSLAILSARISYLLNLKGPSLSIDTACSSSLVAITEACTNLASHTVELALAGGVSVLAGPSLHLMAGHAGMLSTSGRCHTFDQSADGFVPGEGVGVLLLKRLQDALRDGDPVHGVIRGWGINQDGKTNGITAPGVKSQAALEAEIYKKFGIDPETITMVETHGTATRLGDPIEVEALTTAFRSFTEKQRYCVLGSVKSNVGHLLAAAGVAGVLKILLALNEQILPPNSQFQKLNEHIRLEGSPFYINTKALPWSVPEGCLRRAAVSSFGFSGTNAHIVIEEFRTERIRSSMSVTPVLIVLSARNEDRLKAYVTAMAGYIKTHRELSVQDIAYTLQIGREEMEYRLAFVAATCDEIVEMFNRVATSDQFPEGAGIMTGNAKNQQEETNLLMHDEDAGILFRTWIEKGKLDKIGRLWVNGLDIDWRQLYKEHQPARLHLPGYPFARESYWIPSATIPNEIRAGVSGQLHQLLHTNTSVFGKQRFSSVFNGTEFFLKDHMVSGRKTLPGAACIEMVLTAYRQSVESIPEHSSICVEEIVWLRPLVVDGRAETVHVCLHAEGGRVKYEMYGESTTGNPLVYNSGFIAGSAEIQPVRLKPETRLNGCNSGYMTAEACYSLFSNVGLNYGASFRVVKEIFIGEREAVARLELPATMKDSLTSFILHPALLDAAFQSLIGLVPASHKAMVPVAAEKVKVFGGCSSAMWAVVRHSHNISLSDKSLRFDIDLYDENGTIQVSITGLSIMEVGIPKDDTFLMCPGWTKLLTGSNTMPVYHEHIVISCGLSAGIATAIEKELTGIRFITGPLYQGTAQDTFVAYAEWALDTVQQILKGRPEKRMLIQFMTETSSLLSPALAALLSTMTKEQPLCCGQLLEISSNESTDEIIDKLKEGREYPENLYMRCHHRQTEIRQWEEITGLSGSPEHCWKDNGVYLITGGAGGLAVIFVREIVQRVEKPVVILIGRTPLREEQQRYLQELQATGATVVYKQVDVCDRQAVEIMFSSIHNTYGKLNGILHTAGVKKDNFLSKKTTRELQQVLEPKVTGLINIDEASRWLNPDFLILFSSVAGALGNEGQADYAMGNAFMDTYAAYRNNLIVRGDVKGKTLSVNWPLWEDGGMQMNEQIKEWWRQRSGFLPLPSTSGVKALYQAMNTGLTQIMVLCGDKKEIIQKISRIKIILPPVRKEEKITPETIPDRTPSVEKLYLELREGLAGILSLSAEEIDIDENFLNIGFDSIMAMQWLQGINKNYGTDIMAPRVFDYPTIREFAGFLEREMIRMEEERRIGDRQLSKLDFVGDLLLKVQWGIVDIDIADQTLHQLISEKKHHGNG